MNKPAGMSRKDYHNLKAIVREFLRDPSAMVDFSEGTASGLKSQSHDEGYSSSFIEVTLAARPDLFMVRSEFWGSDCDGRHSSENNYIVGETSKRRRFYMSRNWETNRPTGKFEVKSRFKIRERGTSSQRDYTAEAAGY